MRNEALSKIIKLAQELAGSADGMTLDEMVESSQVKRRTVERWRDIIEETFGALDTLVDGRKMRFRLTGTNIAVTLAPTADELLSLENAAREFELRHDDVQAKALRAVSRKMKAKLSSKLRERYRLDLAVEGKLQSEAFAQRVGPHPFADPQTLITLREALLNEKIVKFYYQQEPNGPVRWRRVIPYGLLFGPRYYLVAAVTSKSMPVLFRLDRITRLEITDETGMRPESFDLQAYALRSFGVFQEEPEEILLRFQPEAASEAKAYIFHPTQEMHEESDGSLTVRFHAAGLLEIAQYLMSWGQAVTIVGPERLKEIMWEEVEALYAHYRPKKKGRRLG